MHLGRLGVLAVACCAVLSTVVTPAHATQAPPARPKLRSALAATPAISYGSGNLTNHGGGVESGGSVNYLIFVNMPTTTATAGVETAPYARPIAQFFQDVSLLPLSNVMGQYGISGASTLGGVWSDLTATPSTLMTDAGVQNEVRRALAATGWIGGLGHNFFVFTPPGMQVCDGGCSGTSFCGYHGTMGDAANRETPYAIIPYQIDDTAGCLPLVTTAPNGDLAADLAINVTSHELYEILTDPGVGWGQYGWYDAAGYEVGDKCAWLFGALLVPSTGGDTGTGTHWYRLQEEYSNAISDCRM